MDTVTANTLKIGEKHNSMYEPNSVYCKASKKELEQFYKDSEALAQKIKHIKPNAMSKYSTDNCNVECSLIIEEHRNES